MTTHALIPTPRELDQLPDLAAILRPMELLNPVHDVTDKCNEGQQWCHECDEIQCCDNLARPKHPLAPRDVIAWQEEWYEGSSGAAIDWCDSKIKKQPASTMPEELARFTSMVIGCRPVKLDEITSEQVTSAGFVGGMRYSSFVDYWQSNYPEYPLASWAWYIELK